MTCYIKVLITSCSPLVQGLWLLSRSYGISEVLLKPYYTSSISLSPLLSLFLNPNAKRTNTF